MKFTKQFDSFLKSDVNLDEKRLERLSGSVGAITGFLQRHPTFSEHFIDTIPQGSYAHKTIIKPVKAHHEFDADVLLYLEEVDGWAPSQYVESLYSAFYANGTYQGKVSRRTRCVTINYVGDFHIDIVPYIERHGSKWVTNRADNSYQLTDPEAYNDWLDEKNRAANRHLVKVIRLVKYLRDYKGTFAIKSVILNTLLGNQVNDAELINDPGCYADVPTTLRSVMNRLSAYLEAHPNIPSIMDPALTGDNFSDRWNQDGYYSFRTSIIRYAQWINDAWKDSDQASSRRKWQDIFGSKFYPIDLTEDAATKSTAMSAISYKNTEQKLIDLGFVERIDSRFAVRITGRVTKRLGHREYPLSRAGSEVKGGRKIEFSVTRCTVPAPYDILWKVKNNGEEARRRDCIRGQIERRGGSRSIIEPTSFPGPHFVECYIVKDGVCVAKDRQDVNIV